MKRHSNNLMNNSVHTMIALLLTAVLILISIPHSSTAQQRQPNDQEARALLLLVREAANLIREAANMTGNENLKIELERLSKTLADESGKGGNDDKLQIISFSRSREILRRIIDEQQGETPAFQEKISEALRRLEFHHSALGAGAASVETAFGLHTATFDTLQGTVTVNLPDDLQAGDRISGTVIAEPKGKTESEQALNQSELNGYVVQIDKQEVTPEKQYAKLILPAVLTAIPVVLRNREGKEISRVEIPVKAMEGRNAPTEKKLGAETQALGLKPEINGAQGQTHGAYQVPAVGQAGRPIEVRGPMDGDLKTTVINIGNKAVRLLAESPRRVIAQSPSDLIGRFDIEVREQGKTVAKSSYRSIGVKLSAGKLNMIRGEQTTLTMTLLGADGIEAPVTVQLLNATPWVVRMSGGERQLLLINPHETQGGTYSTTRTLTGVQAGGFSINATVASSPTSASGTASGLPSPGPDRQPSNPTSGSTPIDRRNVNRPERPLTTEPSQREFGPDGEPRTGGGSRPVEPFRGRFRVTLNGFSVNHQTADDRLERDGPGDEVTLVSYVATVESGSRLNPIFWGNIFTSVMGAQPQNEIRAGSASARGGLRTGDGFPTATPALRTTALNPGIPPTIFFEGELVQGQNAAFIIPSIWEWDGLSRRELHERYADAMDGARSNITGFVGRLIQRPPPLQLQNYLLRGSVLGLGNITTIGHGPLGLGEVNNRPIGMLPVEGGFGFTPRVLILTYDAAREFARTDTGRGRGVIVVNYVDDADLEGSYSLFLQIEQVDAR